MAAPTPKVRISPSGPIAIENKEVWLEANIGSAAISSLGDYSIGAAPMLFGSAGGASQEGTLAIQIPLPEIPVGFKLTVEDFDIKVAFAASGPPASLIGVQFWTFIHDDNFAGPTAVAIVSTDEKNIDGATVGATVLTLTKADFVSTGPAEAIIPEGQSISVRWLLKTNTYTPTNWVYRIRVKVKFTKL